MTDRPLHERLLDEAMERIKQEAAAHRPATRLQTRRLAASASLSPRADAVTDEAMEDTYDDFDDAPPQRREDGIDGNGLMYHMYDTPEYDMEDDSFQTMGYEEHQGYEEEVEETSSSSGFVDVESFDDDDGGQVADETEQAYEDSYMQLQALWQEQAAYNQRAAAAAAEKAAEDYGLYMMERVEQEADADEKVAEALRKEKVAKEEVAWAAERARIHRARNAEQRRKEAELKESRRLEALQAQLKGEEDALALDIKKREKRLQRKTEQQSIEREAQLERERYEEEEIASLRNNLAAAEARLKTMREDRERQERELQQEEVNLDEARFKIAAKKEARIKATKDYDDDPSSLSARYSRACTICLSANPRKRAALIACGHMMCATCAEQMSEGPTSSEGQFPCPFCRKMTGYVQTFEDADEIQEVIRPEEPAIDQTSTASRKRKIGVAPSSSPLVKKTIIMPIVYRVPQLLPRPHS